MNLCAVCGHEWAKPQRDWIDRLVMLFGRRPGQPVCADRVEMWADMCGCRDPFHA